MIHGLCFDGSTIRGVGVDGQPLDFCNTLDSGHFDQLESDYALARSMGCTRFREALLWDVTSASRQRMDFTWLNRVAAISQGQIELALTHYAIPRWFTAAEFWRGAAAKRLYYLARTIARSFKGCFRSYNPAVELGTWTNLIAAPHNRQWPQGDRSWWDVYRVTSGITIALARGLKDGDPDCKVALCEPWGFRGMDYDDQARPFNTLLGLRDEVAEANGCHTWQQGYPELLDIVGLNIYQDNGIEQMLTEARQRFPDQLVVVGETANTQHWECNPPQLWWDKFNLPGEENLEVAWCPGLQMRTHEDGNWMQANLIDLNRAVNWQKTV
jgi:hypothetical protein